MPETALGQAPVCSDSCHGQHCNADGPEHRACRECCYCGEKETAYGKRVESNYERGYRDALKAAAEAVHLHVMQRAPMIKAAERILALSVPKDPA